MKLFNSSSSILSYLLSYFLGISFFFALFIPSQVFSRDISDEINGDHRSLQTEKAGVNTQAGILLKASYFPRMLPVSSTNFISATSFYLGGGIFIDYKLFPALTLSLEGSSHFETADFAVSGTSLQGGFFAKHFVDNKWGYVGIGIESFSNSTILSTGAEVLENDLFLSIIITGENIRVRPRINTAGNLRFGISLSNDVNDTEPRFVFSYTLGLGFEFLR